MNYVYVVSNFDKIIGVARTLKDAEELALAQWEEDFYNDYLEYVCSYSWYTHEIVYRTVTYDELVELKQDWWPGYVKSKGPWISKVPLYH